MGYTRSGTGHCRTCHRGMTVTTSHRTQSEPAPPSVPWTWLMSGQEAIFSCWVPIPHLTVVVSSVAYFNNYLLTTQFVDS
jgi:hypothetical protein